MYGKCGIHRICLEAPIVREVSETSERVKRCFIIILVRLTNVWFQNFTKTCLCNFDPFKPHFYIVKLGFTGLYISFLNSAQKYRLWVLVRTASLRQF